MKDFVKDDFGFVVCENEKQIEEYLKNKTPNSKCIDCDYAKRINDLGIKLNNVLLYRHGEIICTYNSSIDKCRLNNFIEKKGLEGKCEKLGRWIKIK